jgi:hypothetical protein
MLLLIHCGCGLGQAAFADIGAIAKEVSDTGYAPKGRGRGCPDFGTLCAQSSGLAIRSGGGSESKIPNGLGSEFYLRCAAIHSGDDGAISSPA